MYQNDDDELDMPELSQEEFVTHLEGGEELHTYGHFGNVYTLSKKKNNNFFVHDVDNRRWQEFATLTDALLAYGLLVGGLFEDPWKKHLREERERENLS